MNRRRFLRMVAAGLGAGLPGQTAAHPTPTVGPATENPTKGPTKAQETGGFVQLGTIPITGVTEVVVGPDGATAYAATLDGFAVVDVTDPGSPAVLAERRGLLDDQHGGPIQAIQDVQVAGDRLLVIGPAHPGRGTVQAALLYDVSDRTDPALVAVHATTFPIHNAFVLGGRAYLTAQDGGRNPLVIVNLSEEHEVVGTWSPVDADGSWAEVESRLRPLHDLWVHDGVAYLCYWDAGTWIVDVSDPVDPRPLGRVGGRGREELAEIKPSEVSRQRTALPGNHHSCVTDEAGSLLAVGKEAWAVQTETGPLGEPGGIDLWDVSTPSAPTRLATISPPPTSDATLGGTWVTAHNFDLGGGRLYSAWYQGGVRVHDVSDPRAPEELAAWSDPARTRFWTAQRAAGCVVAGSMGVGDAPAGVFTFPEPEVMTPTQVPSPTRTSLPTSTHGPTPAREPARTWTSGQPGFGSLTALTGVAAAACLALRRRRDPDL